MPYFGIYSILLFDALRRFLNAKFTSVSSCFTPSRKVQGIKNTAVYKNKCKNFMTAIDFLNYYCKIYSVLISVAAAVYSGIRRRICGRMEI